MDFMKYGLSFKAIFIEFFVASIKEIWSFYLRFQKKSQKTPKKEIKQALKLKTEYFNSKKNK